MPPVRREGAEAKSPYAHQNHSSMAAAVGGVGGRMDGDGACGARDGDVDGGAGGQLLRSACGPLLQHDNKNNPLITQNHPFVCTSLTTI